jgi:hypothetical protein
MSCTPVSQSVHIDIVNLMSTLSFVGLVHEFKQFIDHCLQEFPMCLEESGVLSNDIHDIRCHDGLVVFAPLDFAEAKQVFYNSNEESLFGFFICPMMFSHITTQLVKKNRHTHCA